MYRREEGALFIFQISIHFPQNSEMFLRILNSLNYLSFEENHTKLLVSQSAMCCICEQHCNVDFQIPYILSTTIRFTERIRSEYTAYHDFHPRLYVMVFVEKLFRRVLYAGWSGWLLSKLRSVELFKLG